MPTKRKSRGQLTEQFEAGFAEAREMAAQIVDNFAGDMRCITAIRALKPAEKGK